MKKPNYTFKLKNFEKTYANHESKLKNLIAKMKEKSITKKDLLNDITNESAYNYMNPYYLQILRNEKSKKILTRRLATNINSVTINFIKSALKFHELPESYFTACYLMLYKQINSYMQTELADILTYFN